MSVEYSLVIVREVSTVTVPRPSVSASVATTVQRVTTSAPGPQGVQGPRGPAGAAGGFVVEFHTNDPAGTWAIEHNLNRLVFVSVVDDTGREVIADVDQSDPNTVSIQFATPTAGRAVVS